MLPGQQEGDQPAHGRTHGGGMLPFRPGAVAAVDQRFEGAGQEGHISPPQGGVGIFQGTVGGVIDAHHDQRLDLTGADQAVSHFIDPPVVPESGGLRIDDVLPVVHIEHRVAALERGLIIRGQPDDDVPGFKPVAGELAVIAHRAGNLALHPLAEVLIPPGIDLVDDGGIVTQGQNMIARKGAVGGEGLPRPIPQRKFELQFGAGRKI